MLGVVPHNSPSAGAPPLMLHRCTLLHPAAPCCTGISVSYRTGISDQAGPSAALTDVTVPSIRRATRASPAGVLLVCFIIVLAQLNASKTM